MKLTRKAWESIGKQAGWLKEARRRRNQHTVDSTLYLDEDGLYRLYPEASEDDIGVDVVIEYIHYDEEKQTYDYPGQPAYNEVISVKRADDGSHVHNYDEEELSESDLLADDAQGAEEAYWEGKADALREQRLMREDEGF